jgi:hypothetical protein
MAKAARALTKVASWRQPMFRWLVIVGLTGLWIWAGLRGWAGHLENGAPLPASEALYRTLGAIGVQDVYSLPERVELEIARFVGLFVPLIGLLFAFSGQLFQSLAQGLSNLGAGGHVVVAGSGPAALALADDCAKAGDVVFLAAPELPAETAWTLRRAGVLVVEGDPTQAGVLQVARAGKAAHVVALSPSDTDNLRIEAAVRSLANADPARRRVTAVHVGMQGQALLQEAREMRAEELRIAESPAASGKSKKPASAPIEARPFSLTELAARRLMTIEATEILDTARRRGHARPHLVVLGFDAAAEAASIRFLMTLWSAHFGPPRVTIVTPDSDDAERHFAARYPHARGHGGMEADIGFYGFDWSVQGLDDRVLGAIEAARGPASACLVSTGAEDDTITLALALLRACNVGPIWPVPIYMKEASVSEFSKVYASGDQTEDVEDAYLKAFGAVQTTATREAVLDGVLDQGAAMAHEVYQKGMASRGEMAPKELEALHKGWDKVAETYRNANRGSADHAVVKLWDAGWRPAAPREKGGEAKPDIPEEMVMPMAEVEHARWCAERLMAGWRPPRDGEQRDNRLRIHPSLKPWSVLTDSEKAKDADQVRAAMFTARAMFRKGFKRMA